jgi:hypothetical protein
MMSYLFYLLLTVVFFTVIGMIQNYFSDQP